jgi:hypothetical protein
MNNLLNLYIYVKERYITPTLQRFYFLKQNIYFYLITENSIIEIRLDYLHPMLEA